jgi:NADPH-dependent glutamate synthase beta subunit-like oxidoreductase
MGMENTLASIEFLNYTNTLEKAEVDTLIVDAGRLPEMVFVPGSGNGKGSWQTVSVYKGYSENRDCGVFDTVESGRVSDYTAVVKAVGAGRKIVRQVHHYLNGEEIKPQQHLTIETKDIQNVYKIDDLETIPRNLPQDLGSSGKTGMDVPAADLGFTQELAKKEATRCLDCGLICYTRVKMTS